MTPRPPAPAKNKAIARPCKGQTAPAPPPRAQSGPNGTPAPRRDLLKTGTAYKYKPQWEVTVICASEAAQKKLHAELTKKKLAVRLVRV